MSINETEYQMNIKALQNALAMFDSTPAARLEIEPNRVELTIQGEYAWVVHGSEAIAGALDRTVERYYEKIEDTPVEPDLDIPGQDGIEQIVREIPLAYRGATGRIFQGDEGWGGEFVFGSLRMALKDHFASPEMVEQELHFIIDNCHNFAIGGEVVAEEKAPSQPVVVVVQSDNMCDYILDAAIGHQVKENAVQDVIAPYELDGRFTIVFNLNGSPPRVAPNSEKGSPS